MVVGILTIVENKLREFGIQIPDEDRDGSSDPIVGYQYAELHDRIQEFLEEKGIDLDQFSPFKKNVIGQQLLPEEAQPQRVYCLCEEYEGGDGIREFRILGVSQDKAALRKYMRATIESDPYGLVAENGIDTDSADHFCTKFENGFVEYFITEEKVLSRDELSAQIESIPAAVVKETDGGIPFLTTIAVEDIGILCSPEALKACEYDGVIELDVDEVEFRGALFSRLVEYLEAMEYDSDVIDFLTKTEFFVTYDIATREIALACDFEWSDGTGINSGESSQNLLMPHEQTIVLKALDKWCQSRGFASFEEQVAAQIGEKRPSLAERIGAAETKTTTTAKDNMRELPEKGSDGR